MGGLSDRFAELMARMANSDADLYRTFGEQNTSVRQLVDDLVPRDDTTSASAKQLWLQLCCLLKSVHYPR